MRWIYLLIAGALEITWAVAMKMSNGFSVLTPSIIAGVGYIASAVFLAIALKQLPQGICVILIVVGIAGLKILAKD